MIRCTTTALFRLRMMAATFVMILLAWVTASVKAGTPITIEVEGGRTIKAEVASQTDGNYLWLAYRTRSAELLRPVSWGCVLSARIDGEELVVSQLRSRLLRSDAAVANPTTATLQRPNRAKGNVEPGKDLANAGDLTMAEEASELLFAPERPQRINR